MAVSQNEVRPSDKPKANDLGYLLSNRPWNKESVFDIIANGTNIPPRKGGELSYVGSFISKYHRTNYGWGSACAVFLVARQERR